MAYENIIFETANPVYGVSARVNERLAGNFEVWLRDDDSGRIVGVKYVHTAAKGIELAKQHCL